MRRLSTFRIGDAGATAIVRADAKLRLFCFSYAGGTPSVFWKWPDRFGPEFEICVFLMPGQGSRLREPAYSNVTRVVEDACRAMAPHLDRPFVFFGHSMGGTIAFECARRLQAHGMPAPDRLIVSGCRAPSTPARGIGALHELPRDEFVARLARLGGIPESVRAWPEFLDAMLPKLRADLGMIAAHVHTEGERLDVPITVFYGEQDRVAGRRHCQAWHRETRASCDHRAFPGDHFFVQSAEAQVVEALRELIGPRCQPAEPVEAALEDAVR